MTKLVNRAKMTTATTGTGTITLGSAVDGYQTFAAAGVADADVVRYVIEDGNNWEIGTGTYTASGTTLSRTVSESSNADAAINLTGSAVVFVGAAAADLQQQTMVLLGTLTTTSGSTQTLSGLDLTGYSALFYTLDNVSHDNENSRSLRLEGLQIAAGAFKDLSGSWNGVIYTLLTGGYSVSTVLPDDAASNVRTVSTGITNASTSVSFSWTNVVANFDSGTIKVYGVR